MLATTEPDLIILAMPTGFVLGWAGTGFAISSLATGTATLARVAGE